MSEIEGVLAAKANKESPPTLNDEMTAIILNTGRALKRCDM